MGIKIVPIVAGLIRSKKYDLRSAILITLYESWYQKYLITLFVFYRFFIILDKTYLLMNPIIVTLINTFNQ